VELRNVIPERYVATVDRMDGIFSKTAHAGNEKSVKSTAGKT
jgi:hypothetical protein